MDTVSRNDKAVKNGFERLKRLCQVEGKLHDKIENIIFGENYKPEAKINIKDFCVTIKEKLKMKK